MLEYLESLLTIGMIAAILCTSLNIPFGFGGVYNSAQGALYGAGAYTAALVGIHWTDSFFVCTGAAMLVAALAGAVLIIPAARARHEYFMITSLGLQVVASTFFVSSDLLGGNDGLPNIPQAVVFGATLTSRADYLWLALAGLAVTFGLSYAYRHSRRGRALAAVGNDEEAARSLGINPLFERGLGLVVSAALAGIAGSIYAFTIGFVNPDSFGLSASILVFTMVILGGAGTLGGPILGALVLTAVPAVLTFIHVVPSGQLGALQQVVYGVLLVALVIFRPEGLIGRKKARRPKTSTSPRDADQKVG